MNEYVKNEKKLLNEVNDLLSTENITVDSEKGYSENQISELKTLYDSDVKNDYERFLIELKKQSLLTCLDYLKNFVLKDEVLIYDFSNPKK